MRSLALAGLLVLTVASCAGSDSVDERELLDAGYGVEASGCSLVSRFGSGATAAPGLVYTSAHTVAGATSIEVHTSDGQSVTADLVAIDVDRDLAVLAIGPRTDQLVLEPREPVAGEKGSLVRWQPGEGTSSVPIEVNRRIVVTVEDIYIDRLVERRAVEFTGEVTPGDSGAAIVGRDGRLLGIVYAASRERNVGFALRPVELAAVMEQVTSTPTDPGPCVP